MCQGNLFQSFGAVATKARSPLDFSFVVGLTSSSWLEDLSVLAGVWRWMSSVKCSGAAPLRALKTNSKIYSKSNRKSYAQLDFNSSSPMSGRVVY